MDGNRRRENCLLCLAEAMNRGLSALPTEPGIRADRATCLHRGMGRPAGLSATHRAQRKHLETRTCWEANTMKVVLFCSGYGMRNAVHDDIPKPMQMVGPVVCMGRVQ